MQIFQNKKYRKISTNAPPKGALVAGGPDFLALAVTKGCGGWSLTFSVGLLGISCVSQTTMLAYSKIRGNRRAAGGEKTGNDVERDVAVIVNIELEESFFFDVLDRQELSLRRLLFA
jgi:hypothetical protein